MLYYFNNFHKMHHCVQINKQYCVFTVSSWGKNVGTGRNTSHWRRKASAHI